MAPHWLEVETPRFREGYLPISILLSTALTAAERPLRRRLPEPEPVADADS